MSISTVLSIQTLNNLHALQRIIFILKRNKIDLEQMTIFENKNNGQSHFSLVLQSETAVIEKCLKQLHRVLEILEVKICN